MMTQRRDNVQRRFLKYLMLGLLAVSVVPGCSLDDIFTNTGDSATITIYNQDSSTYWVHLYLVTDDTLIASKYVDSYSSSSSEDTNSFEAVDPDYYYLTITKESATADSGRSGTFHIDENEELSFVIEEDGDIKNYN